MLWVDELLVSFKINQHSFQVQVKLFYLQRKKYPENVKNKMKKNRFIDKIVFSQTFRLKLGQF